MPRPATDKRDRVLDAATLAIHAHGFHQSSLADIAKTAGVPVGSVYYFFKSKKELGQAVIEQHRTGFTKMQTLWEQQSEPADRLVAFLGMTLDRRSQLTAMGCPIGTLCSELQKEGGQVANDAAQIFTELISWLEQQFQDLSTTNSMGNAEHLLGAIQGATLLTHSFRDPTYVEREVERLTTWIHTIQRSS